MKPADGRHYLRLQRVNKAKDGWVYWRREVIDLYDVSPNTLTNWIRAGLPVTWKGNRQLFRGDDLNAFHRRRRLEAKWVCEGDSLPCFRCRSGVSPLGRHVYIERDAKHREVIRWVCSACGTSGRIGAHARLKSRLTSAGITLKTRNANGDLWSGTSLTIVGRKNLFPDGLTDLQGATDGRL